MALATAPRRTALWLVLLMALSSGCTQLIGGRTELPQKRKFIIDTEDMVLAIPQSARPYPYTVQVKKFEIPRFYDRNQLVYRISPEEIREDRRHVWADKPSEMLTSTITDYINAANLFSPRAKREFLEERPRFVISGQIKAIERYDSGDQWYARLALEINLIDQHKSAQWTVADFDEIREVYNPDMSHTVSVMRSILRKQMEQVIRELDFTFRHLQDNPDNGQPAPTPTPAAPADTVRIESDQPDPLSNSDYEIIPGKPSAEN